MHIDDQRFDSLPADRLALAINKELQKLIENVEENIAVIELERVFFSGDLKNKTVVDEFQKLLPSVTARLVEPFNHVHKQLNVESQSLIDKQAEQFMPCLGMILE